MRANPGHKYATIPPCRVASALNGLTLGSAEGLIRGDASPFERGLKATNPIRALGNEDPLSVRVEAKRARPIPPRAARPPPPLERHRTIGTGPRTGATSLCTLAPELLWLTNLVGVESAVAPSSAVIRSARYRALTADLVNLGPQSASRWMAPICGAEKVNLGNGRRLGSPHCHSRRRPNFAG